MFGLSVGHLLVLGIVVLLFGSRRLPELGASLGKGMKAFKDAVDGKGILNEGDSAKGPLLVHQSQDTVVENK